MGLTFDDSIFGKPLKRFVKNDVNNITIARK